MNKYAVVIPAYNDSKTVRDVVQRVLAQCPYVIVIDDGSVDGTADMIADLPVVLLKNDRNCGKAASLWRGIQHAIERGVAAVITLDADGQHQPEDIPRFLEMASKYPDHIMIGSRLADRRAIPPRRYYANRVANFWISWAAGYYIDDSQSGFRLYPASLLRNSKLRVSTTYGFVFESEILIEAARRGVYSLSLPISAIYKPNSRASHFRPVLDIVRITRMVAWRLIARGLYPWGLLRAFLFPRHGLKSSAIGADGLMMLMLSNVAILMTAGISLGWQWRKVYRIARQSPVSAPASEYYLVLGKRLQNGRVTPDYALRLARAADMLKKHPQGKILVLGGVTGTDSISEAQAGKDFLRASGIPESNILIEDASRHTLENLRQAHALLGAVLNRRSALITSRFHLARCHVLASDLGIPHHLCAAEDKLPIDLQTRMRMLGEAYYLHWYVVGKALSNWARSRRMLDKIT